MKARALFAAVVAAFSRPTFTDAPAIAHERVAETEGEVSAASAHRIKLSFERFIRALRGEGG